MALLRFFNLSRPRTANAFVPEIDGLRFLAIFLVVLHHHHYVLRSQLAAIDSDNLLWWAYLQLAKAGGLGVPLFFVISGIVLGLPFARARLADGEAVSVKRYFLRRLRRLEPPYVINLTILFVLAVVSGGVDVLQERLPNYLASVFYLHNVVYDEWSLVNFVAWSLEVEAQFYLLAPLLAVCFFAAVKPQTRALILCAAALVMSMIYAANLEGPFRYTHSILALGQYFLSGFLIADLMVNDRLRGKQPLAIYDLFAVLALIVAICFDRGWPDPALHAMGVVPLTIFFLCVFRGRALLAVLQWPPIFTIGGMCYTIYLYHFWIIAAPFRALGIGDWSLTPAGVLALDLIMISFVFLVSSVLFVFFERPFMNRPPSSVRKV